MRLKPCLLLGLCLFWLSACASLPQVAPGAFPLRAEFSCRWAGAEAAGALLLDSATSGLAQAYGPMGLAAATARVSAGQLSVEDVWGQVFFSDRLPLEDLPGILAGELPRRGLVSRRRTEQGTCLRYVWGRVWLDQRELPVRIVVGQATDLQLGFAAGRLNVQGQVGERPLELELRVLEGGRW